MAHLLWNKDKIQTWLCILKCSWALARNWWSKSCKLLILFFPKSLLDPSLTHMISCWLFFPIGPTWSKGGSRSHRDHRLQWQPPRSLAGKWLLPATDSDTDERQYQLPYPQGFQRFHCSNHTLFLFWTHLLLLAPVYPLYFLAFSSFPFLRTFRYV